MSLREYREKRDFSQTSEPKGSIREAVDEKTFVVQEHHATHLHWGLRLEMDGVLKSWAVPKGVPLEPGVKRLAVQVEDHPVAYIDFAGQIPEGQYGAGTVEIWDNGKFEMNKREADYIELTLKGNRLSGDYVLLHTDGKNWLLFKRKVDRR